MKENEVDGGLPIESPVEDCDGSEEVRQPREPRRVFASLRERMLHEAGSGRKFRGQRELVAHLEGRELTTHQAIRAFCYECMGYYNGGHEDCRTTTCPLYPHNPAGSGKKKREFSEERRQQMRELFQRNLAKGQPEGQ